MTTTLKYLGISAVEIVNEAGTKVLIDPFITNNPMCPLALDEIGDVDIVLVTHGAQDHMGDAIAIAKEKQALLVCGPEVRVHALKNGVNDTKIIAVLWGDHLNVLDIGVQTVECRHVSFLRSGDTCLTGIALSFIITPDNGTRIYNMGDTAIFSDMRLIAELYSPNILLVPVGGEPRATGGYAHMSPREAALATQWIMPEHAIPVHYGPDSIEPLKYRDHVHLLTSTVKVHLMKPGETVTYHPETHELKFVE